MKTFLKKVAQSVGLEIHRLPPPSEPIPVSTSINEAFDRSLSGDPCSFQCDILKARTLHGFTFGTTGWHPFHTALFHLTESDSRHYDKSFLRKYYEAWTPESARDAYLSFHNAPDALSNYPAFATHNPWMEANPQQRHKSMSRIIKAENASLGFPEMSEKEGYGLHGPVSDTKGKLEFDRLINTLQSIQKNGFTRDAKHPDITGVGIKRGDDYRVVIAHGQHRAAVLSFLQFNHIPIRLNKLLNKGEIRHWPQVVNGTWSIAQAESYIDYLFDFDPNDWAQSLKFK